MFAGSLDLVSLDVIEAELDTLLSLGVSHVLFIDDTFNIPARRFKDICRLMIRKRYGFQWFSYFRCANADDEAFDLMAEAGCRGAFLGIESGDVNVLKAMKKVASVDRYRYGIERLNALGILSYASFIVGFPGETDESARNTIRFIEETAPTFYSLGGYFHDPKVPIAARSAEFGLVGQGYAWRHDTMDWRRAFEWVADGHRTITSSTPVPLYSFDLWSLAYYMSRGVPLTRLEKFLGVAAEMLVLGLGDESPAYRGHEQRLLSVFDG